MMNFDKPEDLFYNTKKLEEFLQAKERELEEFQGKLPSDRIKEIMDLEGDENMEEGQFPEIVSEEKIKKIQDAPLNDDPEMEDKYLRDTIPANLKPWYFNKQMPDLLSYDAVGFSLENCLVKFNIKELTTHLIETSLEKLSLVFDYPRTIQDFDFKNNLSVCSHNCAVWDIQNGTILKLLEGKIISEALLGFEKLSKDKIKQMYGDPPVFEKLKWPETSIVLQPVEEAQWIFIGHAETYKIALVCHLIELIKKGEISDKSYLQVAFDLKELISGRTMNKEEQTYSEIEQHYFEIAQNPEKYIIKQPGLKLAFEVLRKENKHVFLLTNSNIGFTNMCLTYTLGKDWMDWFDLVMLDARKPLFYRSDNAFYGLEDGTDKMRGQKMEHVEQFTTESGTDKFFLEGNALFLTRHFQQLLEMQDVRIAMISDKYLDDVTAVHKFNKTLEKNYSEARWFAISVVEELSFYPELVRNGFKPSLIPNYSAFWGKNYFIESEEKTIENKDYSDKTQGQKFGVDEQISQRPFQEKQAQDFANKLSLIPYTECNFLNQAENLMDLAQIKAKQNQFEEGADEAENEFGFLPIPEKFLPKKSPYAQEMPNLGPLVNIEVTGSEKKNFFMAEIDKYSEYAIPYLNSLEDMISKGRKVFDPEMEEEQRKLDQQLELDAEDMKLEEELKQEQQEASKFGQDGMYGNTLNQQNSDYVNNPVYQRDQQLGQGYQQPYDYSQGYQQQQSLDQQNYNQGQYQQPQYGAQGQSEYGQEQYQQPGQNQFVNPTLPPKPMQQYKQSWQQQNYQTGNQHYDQFMAETQMPENSQSDLSQYVYNELGQNQQQPQQPQGEPTYADLKQAQGSFGGKVNPAQYQQQDFGQQQDGAYSDPLQGQADTSENLLYNPQQNLGDVAQEPSMQDYNQNYGQ